jgi:hypothetical protein
MTAMASPTNMTATPTATACRTAIRAAAENAKSKRKNAHLIANQIRRFERIRAELLRE